jgi:hypothetical protein
MEAWCKSLLHDEYSSIAESPFRFLQFLKSVVEHQGLIVDIYSWDVFENLPEIFQQIYFSMSASDTSTRKKKHASVLLACESVSAAIEVFLSPTLSPSPVPTTALPVIRSEERESTASPSLNTINFRETGLPTISGTEVSSAPSSGAKIEHVTTNGSYRPSEAPFPAFVATAASTSGANRSFQFGMAFIVAVLIAEAI